MAKKFVRTTKSVWDAKADKSDYNDSIVFIEDSGEIWSNDLTYGKFHGDSNKLVQTNTSGELSTSNISINGSTLNGSEVNLNADSIQIKPSGTTGSAGQVLRSGGNGSVYWSDESTAEMPTLGTLSISLLNNTTVYNGAGDALATLSDADIYNTVNTGLQTGDIQLPDVDNIQISSGEGIEILDGSTVSLKQATDSEIGGIKVGGNVNTNTKTYPVELNADGVAYVQVPWTAGDSEPVNNVRYAEPSSDFTGVTASGSLIDSVLIKGAQTLTDSEKTQVLRNLGIEDMYKGIPIVDVANGDSINPNCLNTYGEIDEEFFVDFNAPEDNTIVNEYMMEFTLISDVTFNFPGDIIWKTDPSLMTAGHTYYISVINNLGVIGEF